MSNKVVDKRRFDAIKIMIESGAKNEEIEKFMNVSTWVICKVKKSETYEEYRNIIAAINLKKKEKREREEEKAAAEKETKKPEPEQKTTGPVAAPVTGTDIMASTYKLTQLIDAVKKQTEVLTLISNKLAYIVEELAGVPAPSNKEAI